MCLAVSPRVTHSYTDHADSTPQHCTLRRLGFIVPLAPNAGCQARLAAGAQRTLESVGSRPSLDARRVSRSALSPGPMVSFVGHLLADLRQVILAVGILHMCEKFRAFAHEVRAASEQIAGGAQHRRIDIDLGPHAAAEQRRNLLGIDLVVVGLATVNGFHVESMA